MCEESEGWEKALLSVTIFDDKFHWQILLTHFCDVLHLAKVPIHCCAAFTTVHQTRVGRRKSRTINHQNKNINFFGGRTSEGRTPGYGDNPSQSLLPAFQQQKANFFIGSPICLKNNTVRILPFSGCEARSPPLSSMGQWETGHNGLSVKPLLFGPSAGSGQHRMGNEKRQAAMKRRCSILRTFELLLGSPFCLSGVLQIETRFHLFSSFSAIIRNHPNHVSIQQMFMCHSWIPLLRRYYLLTSRQHHAPLQAMDFRVRPKLPVTAHSSWEICEKFGAMIKGKNRNPLQLDHYNHGLLTWQF